MSSTPQLGILYIQESQDQKEVTANAALLALDNSVNAQAPIPVPDADVTLTQQQLSSGGVLQFTGTLTADRYVNVPAINRAFIVRNSATGGNVIVQVVGAAGASVSVPPGSFAALYCDSVGVFAIGGGGGGGTSGGGSGGGTGSNVAYDIIPTGMIDGTNPTFTLPNAPNPAASLQHFKNGRKMMNPVDFTISGNTITYQSGSIPQVGDVHVAGSYAY